MCGRFTLTVDQDELSERFGCPIIVPDYRPRYNVAPSQIMPVVVDEQGRNGLTMMKWGLVPHWSKDALISNKLINARMETAAEKPAFRDSFQRRRCLIPADGYYEWMRLGKTRQPLRIVLKSRELFGFAGLWDIWNDEKGQALWTFTILTTEPVESIRSIHNRMPLIIRREDEEYWLRETKKMTPAEASTFLGRIKPVDDLEAYPVSSLVNSIANDDPKILQHFVL